ncbi:MAG TPA: Stp1/IreP family PP2C-type Ser/Thr phosphatase [Microscillaceae bacterium]|nr:Stp1/IreP family PP2C-type Ser/Thr phosphatase [Microscillaceae bacterium]
MKNFHFGSHTDIGHVRKQNEDAMGYYETSNGYVFVVCDGMGGAAGGATAARMAVNSIKVFFQHQYYPSPQEAIRQSIQYANQQIFQAAQNAPGMQGMGTTCVLVLVRNDQVFYGHVGDSRLYHLSNEKVTRVTKDHSFVQALVDQGVISDDEAETHPRRNELLRALGTQPMVEIDVSSSPIIPDRNDIFLLCTDGLNGLVHDKSIESTLNSPIDVEHKAIKLVQMANNLGGYDNTTVQLIEFYNVPRKRKAGFGEQKSTLGGTLINPTNTTDNFSDSAGLDNDPLSFSEDYRADYQQEFAPKPKPQPRTTPKSTPPRRKPPENRESPRKDKNSRERSQKEKTHRERTRRGRGFDFSFDLDSPIMQVLARLAFVVLLFYGGRWFYKYAVKEGYINTNFLQQTRRVFDSGKKSVNDLGDKYNAFRKKIREAKDFISSTQKSLNDALLKMDSIRNKIDHTIVKVTEKTKDLKKLAEEQGSKLDWILEVNGLKSVDEIKKKNITSLIIPKESPQKVINKVKDLKKKAEEAIEEQKRKLE